MRPYFSRNAACTGAARFALFCPGDLSQSASPRTGATLHLGLSRLPETSRRPTATGQPTSIQGAYDPGKSIMDGARKVQRRQRQENQWWPGPQCRNVAEQMHQGRGHHGSYGREEHEALVNIRAPPPDQGSGDQQAECEQVAQGMHELRQGVELQVWIPPQCEAPPPLCDRREISGCDNRDGERDSDPSQPPMNPRVACRGPTSLV